MPTKKVNFKHFWQESICKPLSLFQTKICIVHKDIYLLHFKETSYKFSKYILCRGKANTIKKKCIYAYFYVINIICICMMDLFMFFFMWCRQNFGLNMFDEISFFFNSHLFKVRFCRKEIHAKSCKGC